MRAYFYALHLEVKYFHKFHKYIFIQNLLILKQARVYRLILIKGRQPNYRIPTFHYSLCSATRFNLFLISRSLSNSCYPSLYISFISTTFHLSLLLVYIEPFWCSISRRLALCLSPISSATAFIINTPPPYKYSLRFKASASVRELYFDLMSFTHFIYFRMKAWWRYVKFLLPILSSRLPFISHFILSHLMIIASLHYISRIFRHWHYYFLS